MLSKMASFSIAGLMIVGGTVALTAPAEAAAKKCAVGNWALTSSVSTSSTTVEGNKANLKLTGGVGTKLKITASSATYDFSKSKPVNMTGTMAGAPMTMKATYRKTLKYGVKLTGAAKGMFIPKVNTATGPATVKTVGGTERLAPMVRRGEDLFVISLPMTSTCTKKTLILSLKFKSGDTALNSKVGFRRIK